MSHVTVIGAGYAGLFALGRLRMHRPDLELVLVEPRDVFVHRIRLHEVASGATPLSEVSQPLGPICERLGVEHRRTRARAVHPGRVELEGGALATDAVLLATGSRTRPAPGPAHTVDDPEGAARLNEALRARPDSRVTVIGGGTTGLETACRIAAHHPRAHVTLWRATPDWGLGTGGGIRVDARLRALGVAVHDGGRVDRILADRTVGPHSEVPHDRAVWCGGFAACPVPVEGAHVRPGDPLGRLAVDPFLRVAPTVNPAVFAAGDVAGIDHRAGCVTALPTGAHAAANLLRHLEGAPLEPFDFRDVVKCIELGPGHGLLQRLDPSAQPRADIGGRAGGVAKAAILALVAGSLGIERALRVPIYSWAGSSTRPRLTEEPA